MEGNAFAFRTDERKRKILIAATEVFAETGYDGASIARVAQRCGLSQPGLLHHYPSKPELLVAVLAYADDAAGLRLGLAGPIGGLDLLDRFPEVFSDVLAKPELVKLTVKIVAEATYPEHPGYEWAIRRYDRSSTVFIAAFQRDAQAGRLREGVDPAVVGRIVIAVLDGLKVQWLVEGDRAGVRDIMAQFTRDLRRSIEA